MSQKGELKKAFFKALPNLMVVCAGVLLFALFTKGGYIMKQVQVMLKILRPFIAGFAIAYILSVPLNFIERKVLGRWKVSDKGRHLVSVVLVYIFALLILAAFFWIIGPQFLLSLRELVARITNPSTIRTIEGWFNSFISNNQGLLELTNTMDFNIDRYVQLLTDFLTKAASNVFVLAGGFAGFVYNLGIGLVLSIYMIYGKDRFRRQLKKVTYAMLPSERSERLIQIGKRSHRVFTKFLIGKLIDSVIIGFMCFGLMQLFRMEYALLISTVVGITNIIPFFGPIIGAIPGMVILLTIRPMTAVWFAILILALQQFDGNILGPFILGDSTGLSAFWVMFAILIGGGLFGFWGMLLGVPAFAVIYSLLKESMEHKLVKKGFPLHTDFYEDTSVAELLSLGKVEQGGDEL